MSTWADRLQRPSDGGLSQYRGGCERSSASGKAGLRGGRGAGVARVSLLNECCEECSQTRVI